MLIIELIVHTVLTLVSIYVVTKILNHYDDAQVKKLTIIWFGIEAFVLGIVNGDLSIISVLLIMLITWIIPKGLIRWGWKLSVVFNVISLIITAVGLLGMGAAVL